MSFYRFWLLALIIKLVISALFPLSGDEAYYWVWAQKIQLSYFDHPPMIAWLFALVPNALKVFSRWPGVLIGHLTFLVWYKIIYHHGKDYWKDWQILALLSPLLGLGSIIVTPDLPLIFFWSLSCWIFLRALKEQTAKLYTILGCTLGLGFISKYTIVFLVPIFLIYLLLSKQLKNLKYKFLPLTILAGIIFCLPVIIWNFQNDWISFKFQWSHGFNEGPWQLRWTTDFIFGTILLFFPTLFWGFLKGTKKSDLLFHKVAAVFPLLFFTYSSFKASVELNWALVSYPHMLLLFIDGGYQRWQKQSALVFWVLLYTVIIIGAVFPSVSLLHEKLNEPFRYKHSADLPIQYAPLFTSTYQMASSLWYVSGTAVYKVKGVSRFDLFDMMPENVLPNDKFFFLKEDYQTWPEVLPADTWDYKEILHPLKGHTLYEVHHK